MSALRNFETFVQRLMEVPFTRLTKSKLQPVELAKRLEREMEASRTISVGRIYVANVYAATLNPSDFAGFQQFQGSLQDELATYVAARGTERGYTLVGPVDVHLAEDARVGGGDVRVQASIREEVTPAPAATSPLRPTRILPAAHTIGPAGGAVLPAHLSIRDEDGSIRIVPVRGDVTHLGRGLDNDIVLDSLSVSRNHAKIQRTPEGQYTVQDLDSTNGTVLNGKQIRENVLRFGDVMRLGQVEVRFESPS